MASFNKFNCFVGDLGDKLHDLDADTLKVYLTNATPAATDTVLGTPADISAGNGYTAGGEDVQNAWSQTSGTGTLTGVDIVWTATGGSIGPFRYAVLYNDTSATDPLIGYWDYGSALTVLTGETFTTDFGASILTLG
jgi:hypothetical protein